MMRWVMRERWRIWSPAWSEKDDNKQLNKPKNKEGKASQKIFDFNYLNYFDWMIDNYYTFLLLQ